MLFHFFSNKKRTPPFGGVRYVAKMLPQLVEGQPVGVDEFGEEDLCRFTLEGVDGPERRLVCLVELFVAGLCLAKK